MIRLAEKLRVAKGYVAKIPAFNVRSMWRKKFWNNSKTQVLTMARLRIVRRLNQDHNCFRVQTKYISCQQNIDINLSLQSGSLTRESLMTHQFWTVGSMSYLKKPV